MSTNRRASPPRPSRRWSLAVAALVVLAAGAPCAASAQEFHIDLSAENVVRFISRASIEEFEGITDRIDGFILLGSGGLSDGGSGEGSALYLEVDLASIDTGIGLRNRHMRDNYLEVDRYPFATFEGAIQAVSSDPGNVSRVSARGAFALHGVTRERDLTCRVEAVGAGYRARCSFEVLLTDHNIEIPKVMFLKLADEIRVELEFSVIPAGSSNGNGP